MVALLPHATHQFWSRTRRRDPLPGTKLIMFHPASQEKRQLMARMKLLERNNARRAAIVAKREAEQVKSPCMPCSIKLESWRSVTVRLDAASRH